MSPNSPSKQSRSLNTPSSESSSTTITPRRPSPLNPAAISDDPTSLSNLDEDLIDFPEVPGDPRGASVSRMRDKSSSGPNPMVEVTSSPASTIQALPGLHEGRLASLVQRARSRSPSGRINENVWRKKVNDPAETPLLRGVNASPSASWWGDHAANAKSWTESETPKKKRPISEGEKKAWVHTRERVAIAAKSVLGTTGDVVHELLEVGGDFLEFAPIPGLSAAARSLLFIWDAMELVDMNTASCLRLTERCAETLIAIRLEIHEGGDVITKDLQGPTNKLHECFEVVHTLLVKESNRPFLKRYLKRDEILRDIAGCDAELQAALDMFHISVSLRILKQLKESEEMRKQDNKAILEAVKQQQLPHAPENALMLTGVNQTTEPTSLTEDTAPNVAAPSESQRQQARAQLDQIKAAQNTADLSQDAENLRQLMRLALQTTSDAEMLCILQIRRQDMPEAIKTLQRALEHVIENEDKFESPELSARPTTLIRRFSLKRDDRTTTSPKRAQTMESESSSSGSFNSISRRDTLDREFLETGIDALRRMSRGVETNLPSWTITKFEVDRDQKIGIGFFSDVYRGTWRGRTVAIKVLADTTPRELFKREVAIWKTLKHPNVLELYGASSTTGDPPWFFVSYYAKNGSLVEFLRRVHNQPRSSGSSFGSGSPHHSNTNLPLASAGPRIERTVTFPIWPVMNQLQTKGGAKSPGRDTEYRRSRDLHRFIYEISKGMEYLHSKNILHGDLKAANVLVDDNLRCVISDFGQSEMKSEAFRISGSPLPHGTLRWQAPELMRGSAHLTQEMDVYAFAICCIEILNWGTLPWAFQDDPAVRYLVLDQNERPPLPLNSRYVKPALQELLRNCWDKAPEQRPPFSTIVPIVKKLRKTVGEYLDNFSSPRLQGIPDFEESHPKASPDIRPVPLLEVSQHHYPTLPPMNIEIDTNRPLQHKENSVPTPEIQFPEPMFFTSSRQSSMFIPASSDESDAGDMIAVSEYDGYSSPPPVDDIIAQTKNERRYRLMLIHEYHPSLMLPLWDPSPVDLGAVGYLSKPRGAFITLFNAFYPDKSSLEAVHAIPSIAGYGKVTHGSQRTKKKTNFFNTILGLLSSRSKNAGRLPQAVNRRHTFPLKAGHKAAFLCTEAPEYRYMMSEDGTNQLDAPKRWFKANVDTILKVYGAKHQIQREDLFLAVGLLRATNYALFVSHNHSEGHAHFNAFASPNTGQPWGMFTTDSEYDGEGPNVGDIPAESSRQLASKVSSHGGPWDAVLVARLRFKPDSSEPTTL